jgi:amidohydrolase
MTLLDEAKTHLDRAVDLRRRIHRHPEIGLDLPVTQKTILEALEGLPLEINTGTGCSSVVAVLEGAHPGPTILLRGDMDALAMPEDTGLDFASEVPNTMHACGHDTHVAMLATAARLLADHREDLHGRVLFMFQPGEEGWFGARVMIDEGLLDGPGAPQAAFAIHVITHEPSGLIQGKGGAIGAAADRIHIHVWGKGGHASAPHEAQDPVPVACEIALALQTMVTRTVHVFDPAVVTIGSIHAGTTDNVIPESAEMHGTVRTLSPETREKVHANVRRVVENVAAAHGMKAELEIEEGYPPTINDQGFADFSMDVAREIVGEDLVKTMDSPLMGAEDFSYVLNRIPGAMLDLGVAPPDLEEPPANHSNRAMVDEPAMANGIAVYAGVALRYLDGTRTGS